jgi:hypothetical protein
VGGGGCTTHPSALNLHVFFVPVQSEHMDLPCGQVKGLDLVRDEFVSFVLLRAPKLDLHSHKTMKKKKRISVVLFFYPTWAVCLIQIRSVPNQSLVLPT